MTLSVVYLQRLVTGRITGYEEWNFLPDTGSEGAKAKSRYMEAGAIIWRQRGLALPGVKCRTHGVEAGSIREPLIGTSPGQKQSLRADAAAIRN